MLVVRIERDGFQRLSQLLRLLRLGRPVFLVLLHHLNERKDFQVLRTGCAFCDSYGVQGVFAKILLPYAPCHSQPHSDLCVTMKTSWRP